MRTDEVSPCGRGRRPALSEESIARAAARFDVLLSREADAAAVLGFTPTARRLFILALALGGPVGSPEIRAATLAMKGSPWFDELRRLQHQHVVYAQARSLEDFGALERVKRGWRRFYRLSRSTRNGLRRVLEEATRAHRYA